MNRQALAAAYRATTYVVTLPGGDCALRIGARSPQLDLWLEANGQRCWSWLTAANPASRRLTPEENAFRLERLAGEIEALGFPALPATAIADTGEWPDEASYFVPALDQATALGLARRHGQNAFLAGEIGQAVCLIWVN